MPLASNLSPESRFLKLTNSNKLVEIDEEDYNRCILFKWGLNTTQTSFKIRRTTVKQINLTNYIMNNYGIIYDHIDQNQFNAKKINLRIATKQENNMNKCKSDRFVEFTSKYKGVHFRANRNRYQAEIKINSKKIYLGNFLTEKEAALAYNTAAKKYHREFASLNEVE